MISGSLGSRQRWRYYWSEPGVSVCSQGGAIQAPRLISKLKKKPICIIEIFKVHLFTLSGSFLKWIDCDQNWHFGLWINYDNGSCKHWLHCKQYSVRGSVIKTYNEPLTDYLQSISALVFSLVKHDTGWCLETWVWRMWRASVETRARVKTENTPGCDTNSADDE